MNRVFDRTPNASAKTSPQPHPLSLPYPPPSRRSVADQYSSEHHERMNHLSASQGQNCSGESGIVVNVTAVSDERCQSGFEIVDRLLIREQGEDAPGEAL